MNGDRIRWTVNGMQKKSGAADIHFLSPPEIEGVRSFHRSFPEYEKTPLWKLEKLAQWAGLGGIYVKDESYRFGLNAFKVLGGSFAIARYLAKRLERDISDLPYDVLTSEAVWKELGEITFATTTDGNHGRGVAWTANRLKQKSVVYMPRGSARIRLDHVRAEGAAAEITEMNYDDTVRFTAEQAEKLGWVIVQDTAWEGYEEIPAWIMQGYGTMALEALEQIQSDGVAAPTHLFVQAGVGSLAGAVQGFFASACGANAPVTVVVEADQADCLYQSVKAGDGEPRRVGGDLATMMAGLACGEPNRIAWEILRDYSKIFVSCPDWVSAKGMRVLGSPLRGDRQIVSGESAAVTAGLLVEIMANPDLSGLKEALGLDEASRVLLFSTEGDTDPEAYRHIVWDGEYGVPGQSK